MFQQFFSFLKPEEIIIIEIRECQKNIEVFVTTVTLRDISENRVWFF